MQAEIPSLAEPSQKLRLEGRHAIVFGAGAAFDTNRGWSAGKQTDSGWGVGKATALVYSRNGATVTCVDRDLASAEATAKLIRDKGGKAVAIKCDATKSAEVREAVNAHVAEFGRIDILHNNIGIVELGGPVECSEENFDKVMAVNLKSVFLSTKYVLPVMMKQRRGSIINVSSIAGSRYTVPWIAYNTSKGALNALTMGIAAQYAPTGIRCNAIAPGLLATPMVYATYDGEFENVMRARDAVVPMGWQGEGWDVGEASVFLASDEARFITGHVLMVDGGSSICMPGSSWRPPAEGVASV
jgi:NAD(P)-dependent dehydrogenase (short-subunit alcohol dehydrogenase family)